MKRIKPFTLLILLHLLVLVFTVVLLIKQKGKPGIDKEQIVVLPVDGVITMDSGNGLASGFSVDSLVEKINQYREKDSIKAIVLRINSPGGSVGAVQEITTALRKFRAKGKFVVSSFADVAASGGYYIACAGDKIVSQPGTLTGSIGVIMQLPNVQALLGKIGVSMNVIKSGAMKDSGSPFRQMSEEEKAYFTSLINDAYGQFFSTVKEGRKLEDNVLKPLADGRIFSGKMALDHKLIDELGGLEEAIELAKKLSSLEGKNPHIVHVKEKPSLERLLGIFSKSPLNDLAQVSQKEVGLLYLMQ